jgi:formyl-CoA transferase
MESLLPEYSAFGEVRQAAGSALPGIAPSNAYLCKDGAYVLIAGNGDSIFKRLMSAIGQVEMANNPDYADNTGRVKHVAYIDKIIGQWTILHGVEDVLQVLEHARVPAGKIYTAADIARDPHFIARQMIMSETQDDGTELQVPGIVQKLSRTPGQLLRKAPKIGQDNLKVLRDIGITEEQIQIMYQQGIIWSEDHPIEK